MVPHVATAARPFYGSGRWIGWLCLLGSVSRAYAHSTDDEELLSKRNDASIKPQENQIVKGHAHFKIAWDSVLEMGQGLICILLIPYITRQ
jgi:hypothetical protein